MAAPGESGIFYAYPPPDAGGRFLADLGFQVPAPIVELAGDQALAEISAERLDLLDTDLLVWLVTQSQRDEVVANDLYTRLDVAIQGRDVLHAQNSWCADAQVTTTRSAVAEFDDRAVRRRPGPGLAEPYVAGLSRSVPLLPHVCLVTKRCLDNEC